MKLRKKKVLTYLAASLLILGAAGYGFRHKLSKMAHRYYERERELSTVRYGSQLPEVDEIKIMRIVSDPPAVSLGTVNSLWTDKMYIVVEKVLVGREAEELAGLWRKQQYYLHANSGCFEPHHVLQFRSKGKTLSESIICFYCGNTTLTAFPVSTLVNFSNGEAPEFLALKEAIEGLVGKAE